MKPWRRVDSRRVHDCRVFRLDRQRYEPPDDRSPGWFYVLDAPHWINVIPINDDDEVLFIRQFRFGTDDVTLEIPGGMCDGDEPPPEAARRELREETGYDATDLTELGWVHPNPAIQNNRCYTYLARGLSKVGEPTPDPNESFEQVKIPLARVSALIESREITHALVVAAFKLLEGFSGEA